MITTETAYYGTDGNPYKTLEEARCASRRKLFADLIKDYRPVVYGLSADFLIDEILTHWDDFKRKVSNTE